jgi:cytochrome c-type biogenesis protein CcmH/NrfG
MANESTSETAPGELLLPKQAGLVAAICLGLGLGIGYVSRGMVHTHSTAVAASSSSVPSAHSARPRVPTLGNMKLIADKQAAPLLAQLQTKPNDSALLTQVAAIYHSSHQFKEAAGYYDKAVQADPENVGLRNRLASSLYRSGDVDGAMAQLNQALHYQPNDANSLFNLGMIRLQGKADGKGALAAWQQLLKSNPQLSADRKAEVQKLMADILTTLGEQKAAKGATGK